MRHGERGTFVVIRGRHPRFAFDRKRDEQRSLARAALVRQRLLTHAEGSPCRAFMPLLLALQAHAFQAPYSVVALVLLVSLLTGIAYPDAYRWVRGAGGASPAHPQS